MARPQCVSAAPATHLFRRKRMTARANIAWCGIRSNREINQILPFPVSPGTTRLIVATKFSGYDLDCEGGERPPGSNSRNVFYPDCIQDKNRFTRLKAP